MNVYFARHGVTEPAKDKIIQADHICLDEEGRQQVKALGERLTNKNIELILSSPLIRAKETSEIINQDLDVEVKFHDALAEINFPSEIIGLPKNNPFVLEVRKIMQENHTDGTWSYSGEETFQDAKERALKFIAYLEALESENILVVTHSKFMKLLVSLMLFGPDLNPEEFVKFRDFTKIINAGLTLCNYNKDKTLWKLITWNDYNHLSN